MYSVYVMYVCVAAKGNALRVVPLFETLNDLNNAPAILTTLFSVTNYVGTSMFVCMYVCMNILLFECMYVCMYVCMNILLFECMYVCMYEYIVV